MRVRDFQQILGKFTDNQKGTIISDCPIYIETMDGRLEEIRKIELQESKIDKLTRACESCIKSRVFKKIYVTYF
jgi:hypothetical protein